jgi:plastocyanin
MVGRGVRDNAAPPANEPQSPSGAIPSQGGSGSNGSSGSNQGSDRGSISGTILFKGTAPVKTIDTSMDPACSLGGKPTLPTEQYAVKGGKMQNVYLYVKSGPPAAMQAVAVSGQPVVLDQQHCQYVPHVIALQAGGYVEFRNSDPTMHNVHTIPTDIGNETVDLSMGPRGKPQMKQFAKPEVMIPVRCNNHPWMNAFINVSATPYFAVSDANGHFEIHGLPPGDYTLAAVQEKLGEKTMQVTVPADGTAKAEFSFGL